MRAQVKRQRSADRACIGAVTMMASSKNVPSSLTSVRNIASLSTSCQARNGAAQG